MTALGAYNSTLKTLINQWDNPHTHTINIEYMMVRMGMKVDEKEQR